MAEGVNLLLVRPSGDELLAAVDKATRAAGELGLADRLQGRRRDGRENVTRGAGELGNLQGLTPTFWRARIAEVMAQPEGRRQWEQRCKHSDETLYVVLAWWADHQGGRHVRVCGGTTKSECHRHYSCIPEDERPPLWHAYPGPIYHRSHAGQSEWLGACSCGLTAPPQALAWMGPRCGPCHDRREEAIVPPLVEAPTIHTFFPGPIYALAFSPDGSALAVARYAQRLTYLDLTSSVSRHLFKGDGHDEVRSLAFSPDGQVLAVIDPLEGGVRLFNVATGTERWLQSTHDWHQGERVAFGPDGQTLAVLSSEFEGVEVWSSPPSWEPCRTMDRVTAMAYAPDGHSLAFAWANQVSLLGTDDWSELSLFTIPGPRRRVSFLDFTPDGCHLVLLTSPDPLSVFDLPTNEGRIEVWDVARCRERTELRADVPLGSIAALAPDGRYLAWVVHDQHHSPSSITFWDVFAAREKAKLEWDSQDMLYDLTFSPDGQTLATGGASGTVKLWPWRQLLELG